MTKLTRIVVSHNSAAALSWQAEQSCTLPTILVDNASSDDSCALARRLGYRVLALPENHGYGRAVMAGLDSVVSELALVVNPDAAIDAEGVRALLAVARADPTCDLFVPRLVDTRGDVFFRHESSLERRENPRDIPSGLACVPMISGAVMLIRVRAFLEFGGFDPAIFLYFEDDDLALRYRAARRPMVYVPGAVAVHLGDRSSDEGRANRVKDVSFGWSRAYSMRKHDRGSRLLALLGMCAKCALYLVAGRWARLRRQGGRIRGFVRALSGAPAPYLPREDGLGEALRERA